MLAPNTVFFIHGRFVWRVSPELPTAFLGTIQHARIDACIVPSSSLVDLVIPVVLLFGVYPRLLLLPTGCQAFAVWLGLQPCRNGDTLL